MGAGSIPVPSTLIAKALQLNLIPGRNFGKVNKILIKKFTQKITGYINTKYCAEVGSISQIFEPIKTNQSEEIIVLASDPTMYMV